MNQDAITLPNRKFYAPGQPALISGNRTVNFEELRTLVKSAVMVLADQNVRPNERIAITSANSIEYVVMLLGLWSVKAVACPVNIRYPQSSIRQYIKKIDARTVSLSEEKAENITEPFSPFMPDQHATVLMTSGSSGEPKAVLHTMANHVYSAYGSQNTIPVKKGDGWLLSLPLYHVGGMSILFRTLLNGGCVIIPEPGETLEGSLSRYPVTHVSMVPTQLMRLTDQSENIKLLEKLKVILLGGSAIPKILLDKCSRLPLYITYGLTETASQVATGRYPGPVLPLQHSSVKIAEDGEILVNGETVFAGYVQGDTIDLPLNSGGLFATGDTGYFDEAGGLHVTGRKDNMFVSGGENIQPEAIERSLCEIEGIEGTAVVPVFHAEYGARPVAFIKTKDTGTVSREALCRHLRGQLPKYMVPDRFYQWPQETSKGIKTDRRSLMQKAEQDGPDLTLIE